MMSGGIAVGALLLEWFSWRMIFWANVPLLLFGILFCKAVLPSESSVSQSSTKASKMDTTGTVLLITVVTCALLGINRVAVWGMTSPFVLIMFAFTVVAAPLFVYQQRTAETPLLPQSLLADRFVQTILLLNLFFEVSYHAAYLALPFFLQEVLLMPPSTVGMVSIWRPIAYCASGIIVGKYLTSSLRLVSFSFVAGSVIITLILFGYFLVLPCGFGLSHLLYVLPIVLVLHGFGQGLLSLTLRAAAINRVPTSDMAAFTGFTMVTVTLTQVAGQNMFMALVEVSGGTAVQDAYFLPFAVLIPWSCIATIGVCTLGWWIYRTGLQLQTGDDERATEAVKDYVSSCDQEGAVLMTTSPMG